jgi:hypothetical protein
MHYIAEDRIRGALERARDHFRYSLPNAHPSEVIEWIASDLDLEPEPEPVPDTIRATGYEPEPEDV